MSHSNNIISAPVALQGDIWAILGTAQIGPKLGQLIRDGAINKWAKYKPFRCPSAHFDTDDGASGTRLTDREKARQAALYGFSPDPSRQSTLDTPAVTFTNGVMDNKDTDFVYSRPNGSPYWYRRDDFIGYWHDAVMGFKIELNNIYYDNINGGVFYFGLSAISGFDSRYCLTPQDVLRNHGGKMVGLLLSKAGASAKYFVSTGKTLNEVRGTVGVVLFSGQEVTGATGYAVVPALANEWRGEQVTAAAVLAPASYDDPTQCYDFGSLYAECYSLEFTRNLDRVTLTVTRDTTGVDLNKLTIARYSTPTGIHGTTDAGNWHYYNNITPLSLSVYAGAGFSSVERTVYYELELTEATSTGAFVPSSSSPVSEGMTIRQTGSISIALGQTQYIGYTFAAATALKVFREAHAGRFNITLILSTEPNRGGQTKTFTDTITLGTW